MMAYFESSYTLYDLVRVVGLLVTVWILFKLYEILIYRRFFHPLCKIPGPPPDSFINGNFWKIYRMETMDPQLEFANKYGDIVSYRFLFNAPRIIITGANELKHVLVMNEHNYIKDRTATGLLQSIFGEGLLLLEGKKHRQHRKMIQPAFNYQVIREMVPIFEKKANELVRRWKSLPSPRLIDASAELANLTLDVIGMAAFGFNFNTISDPESGLQAEYKTVLEYMSLGLKMIIPFYRFLPFEENRRLKNALSRLKANVHNIIAKKRSGSETGTTDLLDIMIRARDEDDGKDFSDVSLFAHTMIFLFAGHETTSTAMSWFFYALDSHPEIESKILDEIKTKIGDKTDLNAEDLDKLTYLNNCVLETLRLYPPAAMTNRVSLNDDVIGGYKIPAGTRVIIAPGVTHRLEKYWGSDALEFKPDRWDDPVVKEKSQYIFMPFLLGPRTCIGNKFAMMEMKTVLVVLLRNFHLSHNGEKVKRKLFVTMKPHPTLKMFVKDQQTN